MPKKARKTIKKNDQDLIEVLTADLQRIQADFINFKTRTESNRIKDINLGKEKAIEALLPILDNLERAIAHEPRDIKSHPWVKGVAQMVKQLDTQLRSIGVVKINNIGEAFDPYKHEAVMMEESSGNTEVVADILQAGYQFGETIIRPAKVKVKRV
ncbi:nucleotide exchange factor GrpE [Candidatus Saccharibacteria bacterium]|jgi:molecular chaperone GrpE|nr:nucleotide exchange factor GrpE [Candidatus Saccharibacteria bacterium]HOR23560.1 nucleotide exchange factor GrpE [Candidatus Saccharibacteria bacterium]HPW47810.1 nucleotide exchange factor GrpE [Candidatus Saccharibacteria bacterium]